MREAERREEACNALCKKCFRRARKTKTRLSKIDTSYVSEMEGRIKSGMEAAQVAKLAKLEKKKNLKDEVEALAEISRLGYEEAKFDMKTRQASKKEETPVEQPQEINQPTRRVDPNAQEWAEKKQLV